MYDENGQWIQGMGGWGQAQGAQFPVQQSLTDNPVGAVGGAGGGGMFGGLFSQSSLFGGKDPASGAYQGGWAMPAIAAGGSLLQGLMGMKQYGLAQDQFKESKRQYNQNYNAQKQTVNTQLEDRQRARVASNPGAYQSVSDYLDKNKVV